MIKIEVLQKFVKLFEIIIVRLKQSDQMTKMFAQYLAINNNINWSKSTQDFTK